MKLGQEQGHGRSYKRLAEACRASGRASRTGSTGLEQGTWRSEKDGNAMLRDSKGVWVDTKCDEDIKNDGDRELGGCNYDI